MKIKVILAFIACLGITQVYAGTEAQYYVQSALEGQTPPITRVKILTVGTEQLQKKIYWWWEMTIEKRDGNFLGIRILSERVPMTCSSAPGEIMRYIYSPSPGVCLDYRDERTGCVVLPAVQFVDAFLPHAARDARYTDGFASCGRLLGHVLVRSRLRDDFPSVQFQNIKILKLRPDLLIGAQIDYRDDRDPTVPLDKREYTPYTKEDYDMMIAAGANYFGPLPENRAWIENEPVFWRGQAHFPDDLYRSNYVPGQMFLDEPVIRFGWDKNVPSHPPGPEVLAEAITTRIEAMERPSERKLNIQTWPEEGALVLVAPPTPLWETQYWSAYYQLAGGAPGTIHEGRYVPRGYGFYPEALFGEGLEGLSANDQFNHYYAFLRGAARAFDGWWGTAIYPESDPGYRLPAIIKAYDMGARAIWFWTHADKTPYLEQLRLIKSLMEYAKAHPRGDPQKLLHGASVGIVFPPGYAFDENGIWGTEPEQLNEAGVSYGNIAAAAVWEGIICSRRNIGYDFLVDRPDIQKLGYKQLYVVQKDGTVKSIPPRKDRRAPTDLKLSVQLKESESDSPIPHADYQIRRAGKMEIDADLSEWNIADWVALDGEPYIFGDTYEDTLTITIPDPIPEKPDAFSRSEYLGFSYDDPSVELFRKYRLDLGPQDTGVVINDVRPGSPADQAGLRVGDVLYEMSGQRTRWIFEIYRVLQSFRKNPGAKISAKIKRNGFGFLGGSADLSARVAFLLDDTNLYVAAEVTDDIHRQNKEGWDLWSHDSVQIGIDPIFERLPDGYGENGHEIGFALRKDKPVVWRWKGRRGQPIGDMTTDGTRAATRKPGETVEAVIKRAGNKTIYEVAVPLSDFFPFAPDMWSKCGINIVVNDCDYGELRKSRLELRPGATTAGKHPSQFAVFECVPSPNTYKLSSALFWNKRCLQPGGRIELTLVVSSPKTTIAIIRGKLSSLDDPQTRPVCKELKCTVTPNPQKFTIFAKTNSPPGRYRFGVEVLDTRGQLVARDELPVYIYP